MSLAPVFLSRPSKQNAFSLINRMGEAHVCPHTRDAQENEYAQLFLRELL